MLKKPLFVDQNGVINKSVKLPDYLNRVEKFEFILGTFEAMQKLRDAGYVFYIITNEAGVSRGQATMQQIQEIQSYMVKEFQKKGITVEGIYTCPHQDSDNCDCRKPKPGLLLRAMAEHNLDPASVVFVGDRETDRQAAAAAGVRSVIIAGEIGLQAALSELIS